jgi:hypothetical protein
MTAPPFPREKLPSTPPAEVEDPSRHCLLLLLLLLLRCYHHSALGLLLFRRRIR